jgi:hypothetical protein
MLRRLKDAAREVTGKGTSAAEGARWSELGDLLIAELKIAAARTTVSSAPAFLTEHLRRRLWKKDKAQLDREEKSAPEPTPQVDARNCPDCGGSGWWYPQGTERGVAKCQHVNLQPDAAPMSARTVPAELSPAQLAEQVELLRSLIGHGTTLADLDAQFAGNFQPE